MQSREGQFGIGDPVSSSRLLTGVLLVTSHSSTDTQTDSAPPS
nr:unnamed protein product [Callosobruchus chinensis]